MLTACHALPFFHGHSHAIPSALLVPPSPPLTGPPPPPPLVVPAPMAMPALLLNVPRTPSFKNACEVAQVPSNKVGGRITVFQYEVDRGFTEIVATAALHVQSLFAEQFTCSFTYTVLRSLPRCIASWGHPCKPLTTSIHYPHLRLSLCSLLTHLVSAASRLQLLTVALSPSRLITASPPTTSSHHHHHFFANYIVAPSHCLCNFLTHSLPTTTPQNEFLKHAASESRLSKIDFAAHCEHGRCPRGLVAGALCLPSNQ